MYTTLAIDTKQNLRLFGNFLNSTKTEKASTTTFNTARSGKNTKIQRRNFHIHFMSYIGCLNRFDESKPNIKRYTGRATIIYALKVGHKYKS